MDKPILADQPFLEPQHHHNDSLDPVQILVVQSHAAWFMIATCANCNTLSRHHNATTSVIPFNNYSNPQLLKYPVISHCIMKVIT